MYLLITKQFSVEGDVITVSVLFVIIHFELLGLRIDFPHTAVTPSE